MMIAAVELPRRFHGKPIDALSVFNVSYFVLYAVVPINVICLGEDVVRQRYAYEKFGYGNAYTALALMGSYILFCLGYWVKSGSDSRSNSGGAFSLQGAAHVAKIIFFIGALLTAIYVVQIGGVSEAVSTAADVRSGKIPIESKYIFYRHFAPFSADAFVLFCVLLMAKKVKETKITRGDKVFLVCAFVFFAFYALTTAGRRPFIYPILSCFLVYWSVEKRVLKKTLLLAFVLIFVIAGIGTMLGTIGPVENPRALLELTYNDPALLGIVYYGAMQGMGDSFMHFVAAQNANLWQFGFLTDIVNLPRDFLPSRLLGFERNQQVYDDINEFMLGYRIPEGFTGGELLGLHGYLLVDFGYVGMFAWFFVFGLLYKWMHARFMPAEPKDAVGWLIYWWLVLGFFAYFREGFLGFVLKDQLTWWITTALLFSYHKKQLQRTHAETLPVKVPSSGKIL